MRSANPGKRSSRRPWRLGHALVFAAVPVLFVMTSFACKDAPHAHDGHGEAAHAAEAKPVDMGLGERPPFEWMGVYTFPAGKVDLVIQPGPDPGMDIALIPVPAATPEGVGAVVKEAGRVASGKSAPTAPGSTIAPGTKFYQLQVGGEEEMRFP